jgi:hypothetical protein
MNYLSQVTEKDVVAVKAKYPQSELIEIDANLDDGQIFEAIFIKPTNESIAKYVSASARGSTSGNKDTLRSHAAFVMENIVFPTREDFFELTKKLPLLCVSLSNELMTGSGLAQDAKKKTL